MKNQRWRMTRVCMYVCVYKTKELKIITIYLQNNTCLLVDCLNNLYIMVVIVLTTRDK